MEAQICTRLELPPELEEMALFSRTTEDEVEQEVKDNEAELLEAMKALLVE